MNPFIFCVIGKSGSGKTTLVDALCEMLGLSPVESYTDRPKRRQDEKGHTFVSPEQYNNITGIVAETLFNNYRYCATADQIDSSDLYVVDVEGFYSLLTKYKGNKIPTVIYIDTDPEVCFQRMLNDGRSISDAAARVAHDHKAFQEAASLADFVVDGSGSKEIVLQQTANFITSLLA